MIFVTARTVLRALAAVALIWLADDFARSLMGEIMRRQNMSAYHWDGTRAGIAALPPNIFDRLDAAQFNVSAFVLIVSGFVIALAKKREPAARRFGFVALVAGLYWLMTGYTHFTAPTIGHLHWLANLPLIVAFVCGGGALSLMLPHRKDNVS